MNLQEFITESISQVVGGVGAAGEQHGDFMKPAAIVKSEHQRVYFDVAITVTEGNEAKGGIGLVVGPVTLGSTGSSSDSSMAVSRVKFSVPLNLGLG